MYDREPEKSAEEWKLVCDCECCCVRAEGTRTGGVFPVGQNSPLHGGNWGSSVNYSNLELACQHQGLIHSIFSLVCIKIDLIEMPQSYETHINILILQMKKLRCQEDV